VAKIVTFNFDRIIEYRTLKAVMGRLRRDQAEAATEAARLEIVHVSGILGQPEWSAVPNRQMVAFGRPPNPESIRTAASQISFVHEPRAAAAIDHARSFICAAPLVAFVGFGFNAQNVEALDVRSCRVNTVFIGSAHGLDTAEARGIEAHFKRVLRLYDCDARQFLRHAPNLHRVKLRQPAPLDWEDYKQADRTFVERRNRRPEKPE
jgi:hypothetical protein